MTLNDISSMPLDDKQKVTFGLKVNLSSALTAATDGGERHQTSEESRSWMFKVPTLSLEEGDGAVQFSLSAENQLSGKSDMFETFSAKNTESSTNVFLIQGISS